ncbi:FGGY-family carbohydrate kinase [Zhihengliuella flava]|uniref:Sugar (Pentulose or hexulose) kinase n=1 Tax=Zhihengliuella flava TaxID=1285193 RepID=A0A931DBL7_9MICC|nr:FGGY-family carbohydrate kinase [Zhihengliuella flava]MBG6085467.1 sugar (pentulose or hexulose) kinase [Zhihengliuella flava]
MAEQTSLDPHALESARTAIADGRVSLGIEFGSTNIKACLIDEECRPLATGSHAWENQLVDGYWTYALEDAVSGMQAAFADLRVAVTSTYGVSLSGLASLGVSAMMHGYLPFADGELLANFRTWRNTNTGAAAAALTESFGVNIPLRWSIAHLHQAILDGEEHVRQVDFLTTLAGYIHWRLTGRQVLGVGDASGMFPVTGGTAYDAGMVTTFDQLTRAAREAGQPAPAASVVDLLPEILTAGADAGRLSAEGAALLDPTGELQAGALACPPEGDAGTGMVATNAVAPRTGNVSAGTSIFAMVVLEQALGGVHHEIDLVTTPAGDPVAMVHCNNGASELGAWAGIFGEFADALGAGSGTDEVFSALFAAALDAESDAGGLLAYNFLSGEPIAGLEAGRPLFARTPDSSFTLGNFMRAQVYGVFGTLSLGLRVLEAEGVTIETMLAHGGLFKTAGAAQRFLSAAVDAPVAVAATAATGGSWGMAVLAAYRLHAADAAEAGRAVSRLGDYLSNTVFADVELSVATATEAEREGYLAYLQRYEAALPVDAAAAAHLT